MVASSTWKDWAVQGAGGGDEGQDGVGEDAERDGGNEPRRCDRGPASGIACENHAWGSALGNEYVNRSFHFVIPG